MTDNKNKLAELENQFDDLNEENEREQKNNSGDNDQKEAWIAEEVDSKKADKRKSPCGLTIKGVYETCKRLKNGDQIKDIVKNFNHEGEIVPRHPRRAIRDIIAYWKGTSYCPEPFKTYVDRFKEGIELSKDEEELPWAVFGCVNATSVKIYPADFQKQSNGQQQLTKLNKEKTEGSVLNTKDGKIVDSPARLEDQLPFGFRELLDLDIDLLNEILSKACQSIGREFSSLVDSDLDKMRTKNISLTFEYEEEFVKNNKGFIDRIKRIAR